LWTSESCTLSISRTIFENNTGLSKSAVISNYGLLSMDECMFNNPSNTQTFFYNNDLNITNSVSYGTEFSPEPLALITLYIANTSFYNSCVMGPSTAVIQQSTFVSSNVNGFFLVHFVINESLLIDSTLVVLGEWSIYNTVSNNTIIAVYGSLHFMNTQLYISQVPLNVSNVVHS